MVDERWKSKVTAQCLKIHDLSCLKCFCISLSNCKRKYALRLKIFTKFSGKCLFIVLKRTYNPNKARSLIPRYKKSSETLNLEHSATEIRYSLNDLGLKSILSKKTNGFTITIYNCSALLCKLLYHQITAK